MNKEDLKHDYLERFSIQTVEGEPDYKARIGAYRQVKSKLESNYSDTDIKVMLQEWKKEIV